MRAFLLLAFVLFEQRKLNALHVIHILLCKRIAALYVEGFFKDDNRHAWHEVFIGDVLLFHLLARKMNLILSRNLLFPDHCRKGILSTIGDIDLADLEGVVRKVIMDDVRRVFKLSKEL